MNADVRQATIDHFLQTGECDLLFAGWPGESHLDSARRASRALLETLIDETRRCQGTVPPHEPLPVLEGDLVAFTRAKVERMVRGLFPKKESEPVLTLLERSVVFLTSDNFETAIRQCLLLNTSWQVANLYLASIGAEPFNEDRKRIVGISVDTTCYVSQAYFREEDPFADFVVHEAAHLFHNTKRGTVGFHETRRREWLLPIDFRKRETFAYACEVYSQILEKAKTPGMRRALVERLQEEAQPPDDRVDPGEFFSIVTEAVSRRNGWKAILARCSG